MFVIVVLMSSVFCQPDTQRRRDGRRPGQDPHPLRAPGLACSDTPASILSQTTSSPVHMPHDLHRSHASHMITWHIRIYGLHTCKSHDHMVHVCTIVGIGHMQVT